MDKSSYTKKWFIDYLSGEFYNSLSGQEQNNYREYSKYQNLVAESTQKIEKYQKKIESLKQKISGERLKLDGGLNTLGWKGLKDVYYSEVSHIYKNYTFNCTIERRDRSSKSAKMAEGKLSHLPAEELLIRKYTYAGKKITRLYKIYARVQGTKHKVNFYLGSEDKIRDFLEEILCSGWKDKSWDDVKRELRLIISQYTRFKVFQTDWERVKSKTHNLQSVKKWVEFCQRENINRGEWG